MRMMMLACIPALALIGWTIVEVTSQHGGVTRAQQSTATAATRTVPRWLIDRLGAPAPSAPTFGWATLPPTGSGVFSVELPMDGDRTVAWRAGDGPDAHAVWFEHGAVYRGDGMSLVADVHDLQIRSDMVVNRHLGKHRWTLIIERTGVDRATLDRGRITFGSQLTFDPPMVRDTQGHVVKPVGDWTLSPDARRLSFTTDDAHYPLPYVVG